VSPMMEFGDDPDSILLENIMATVAQYQRQKNAQQVKNRMRARIMNGYWTFQAPIGMRYTGDRGPGRILRRDEPLASVVQDGLEGFASGRFENQADLQRFFQRHPLFPKNRKGEVRHQLVCDLLTQVLYAGYVERPNWGVTLRPGRHEGLISWET